MTDSLKSETSCFWRHRWGKWIDIDRKEVLNKDLDGPVGIAIKQERRCEVCNQVALRTEKTTL